MEIKRFYGSKLGSNIVLTDREYFHCVKVTRHKTGYSLICCVGDGLDYHCIIESITSDTVYCKIVNIEQNNSEVKGRIILCQALCKEFDFVVQKAVELGVTDIMPFDSERTNVKKYSKERTESIVLDASKQCGRAVLPTVYELSSFEKLLNNCQESDNKLFCYEQERERSISSSINDMTGTSVIFIGSEGGFSEREVDLARNLGYNIVTLGRRILRVETAAVSALVLLLDALGDIC